MKPAHLQATFTFKWCLKDYGPDSPILAQALALVRRIDAQSPAHTDSGTIRSSSATRQHAADAGAQTLRSNAPCIPFKPSLRRHN